jgi:phosphoribosylanthranilate isomerase
MSLWIKICANTSVEDALMGVEAGADALGFVFAPSPRRVTAEQAAAIVRELPEMIEKIGVFVDATADEVVATVRACGLTGVQLHFDAEPELTAELRARLGAGTRILRVMHFGAGAAEELERVAGDANADEVLVDSWTATAVGGTGQAYDWAAAGETLFQNAGLRMVAAGGLTPENVAEAIRRLRPWGVDVVSGVEAAPGRKDAAKMKAFVANARKAMDAAAELRRP